jgi:hypothetical protein
MLERNCRITVSGTIAKRDAATFAYIGATSNVFGYTPGIPEQYYFYIAAQDAYSFGAYNLALNVNSSKTYWREKVEDADPPTHGRAQFVGGDSRCSFQVDFFVYSASAPVGEIVLGEFGYFGDASRKTIDGCLVFAVARVQSTYRRASIKKASQSTSGTVTPLRQNTIGGSSLNVNSYKWARVSDADGYMQRREYTPPSSAFDSANAEPSRNFAQTLMQQNFIFIMQYGAFWKSSNAPAESLSKATELLESFPFTSSADDGRLTFSETRSGALVNAPHVWQPYSSSSPMVLQDPLLFSPNANAPRINLKYAAGISFLDRVLTYYRSSDRFRENPIYVAETDITLASQFYYPLPDTYEYSLPVTVALE